MVKKIIDVILSRIPRTIQDKSEFYIIYNNFLFGNRALAWNTLQEIQESGYSGNLCMRYRKGSRKKIEYNIPLGQLMDKVREWEKQGVPLSEIAFNQAMLDEKLLIQGEVKRDLKGLALRYSTLKLPMLKALESEDKNCEGLKALFLLKQNLWPQSILDLEELLEVYPESVIEFSSYETSVGHLPNRNTVFWEVRNY